MVTSFALISLAKQKAGGSKHENICQNIMIDWYEQKKGSTIDK